MRCLRKEPADRLHDIADARIEIVDALDGPDPIGPARPWRSRQLARYLLAAAVVGFALFGLVRALTPSFGRAPAPTRYEFGITLPLSYVLSNGLAVSPDGNYVAASIWGKASEIWVHSLRTATTRVLPGTEGALAPFWSPDSARIAFHQRGKLWAVDVEGNAPTLIVAAPLGSSGASWNRAGVILYSDRKRLFQVPAAGGAPVEVPLTGVTGAVLFPRFLSDGRHFVFFEQVSGSGWMRLASLDSPRVTALVESDWPGTFTEPDQLLFVRHATLIAQKLDLTKPALIGEPRVVATGITKGVVDDFGYMNISASEAGTIAFSASRSGSAGQLTWFDRDGRVTGTIDASASEGEFLNPSISPDGASVAVNRQDPRTGDWDIWIWNRTRGTTERLTASAALDADPIWSHDGRTILFASEREGRVGLYRQAVGATSAERLVDLGDAEWVAPTDWSQDGRHVIFHRWIEGGLSIWALSLDRPVLTLLDARPHTDVTRDGLRLLARQPSGPQQPGIKVILNWSPAAR